MAVRFCSSFYWPNYGREGELFPIQSRHPVYQAWRVADEPVFGGTISVLYMAVKADDLPAMALTLLCNWAHRLDAVRWSCHGVV